MKRVLRRLQARCERPVLRCAAFFFERRGRREALRLATRLGDLGWLLSPKSRRRCHANLEVMFGGGLSKRRRDLLTRGCFRHMGRVLVDFFWFSHDSRNRGLEWITLESDLLAWFKRTRSGIVVTGHIGNWEAAGQMTALYGFPLTSVAQQIGTPETTEELNRRRSALGQRVVMKDGAVRALMHTLWQGGHVALVMDQYVDPTDGGVWVDFFGLPATISNAAAKLSRRLDVPVAVCFAQALPDGSYKGRLVAEVLPDKGERSEEMTQRIATALESMIRRYPSQWLMCYKRWKCWPPGADPERFPYYARPWKAAGSQQSAELAVDR